MFSTAEAVPGIAFNNINLHNFSSSLFRSLETCPRRSFLFKNRNFGLSSIGPVSKHNNNNKIVNNTSLPILGIMKHEANFFRKKLVFILLLFKFYYLALVLPDSAKLNLLVIIVKLQHCQT